MSRRAAPQYQTVRGCEARVSVFVRAADTLAGRPLYCEIIERARDAGLSGATAVRGLTGFGASRTLRSPGLAALRGSEPVLIEITDEEARIRAFLPVLERLVGSGLVVLSRVTVRRRAATPRTTATVAPS
ncbi:MAG TPA: DUF190 domain-containing protein [Streptosporangiaceae bacterium]|nr:DUF190 domain-containing protein [Streptosporangiaceae bacterium]